MTKPVAMRRASVLSTVRSLFAITRAARVISVNLDFRNAVVSGGGVTGLGTDEVTLGAGALATLTFARLVFVTHASQMATDNADVFSGLFDPMKGIDGIYDDSDVYIGDSVSFGRATVNVIPEPATFLLLGLGIGALTVAARRRS